MITKRNKMKFSTENPVSFRLNTDELRELTDLIDLLQIDHSGLTARQTFNLLFKQANETITTLTTDSQNVNNTVIEKTQAENTLLSEANKELALENEKLQSDNKSLTIKNEKFSDAIIESADDRIELENKIEILESVISETKEVTKEIPVKLNPFQVIVELNHFQLRLAAQVANHHSVQNSYNELAQGAPVAFSRLDGEPKEKVAQLLKNVFIGVQLNENDGDGFVPSTPVTKKDLREARAYHFEKTKEEE